MQLHPGQRITAPFLPTAAEVKQFQPRAGYYLLEVVLDDGQHTYKPLRISEAQLAQVTLLSTTALERAPAAYAAEQPRRWQSDIHTGIRC